MTVLRFNHVNVSVADMDSAITFWQDGLGMSLRGRGTVEYDHLDEIVGLHNTKIEWAELEFSGNLIELFRYHKPAGQVVDPAVNNPGTTHLAFDVDDLETIVHRLHTMGFSTASPRPVTIPFGDWAGWRCIYVQEPNGVTVELLERS